MFRLTDYLHTGHPLKIAVFRPLQLGDLLCSIPAFRALRMAYPNALISLIGLPWATDFVTRFSSYFDDFIPFPGYPGMPEQIPNFALFPEFIRIMQQSQFDLVLQMNGNGVITNPLCMLFKGKITAGYYKKGNYCPNKRFFMPYPNEVPEVKRHIELLRFLGIPARNIIKEFPILSDDVRDFMSIKEVSSLVPKRYVCIHAGARAKIRQMNPAKFAAIADMFSAYGFDIVLTGTKSEKEITQALKKQMHVIPIDLTGKTTLGSLAVLLKHSYMLVANDTGVSHIADALKVPSVIIFNASDPLRWAPLNTMYHRIVEQEMSDEPDDIFNEAEKLMKSVYGQSN